MEIIVGLFIILIAGVIAVYIIGLIFAGAVIGGLMFAWYVLPQLALTIFGFALNMICAAFIFAALTLREITGHAARGLTPWETQPQWQSDARERVREERSVPQIDGWESACKLLGLPLEGFTKADLSIAYRTAIVIAHPDVGGSQALAKALNVARDLISQQQGWAQPQTKGA
ncbi:hypothetical protein QO034_20600 [Sedimentitalea sp. JM2-8]|uniref:J domain-containing protein n=1 Tax=Sedimentitalea xiamensis TaxID=3050037 RepID=A0ABT7FL79_9RHOB|nr:hypothetical protein [Sedimentitalea xiamensis]MDK3075479.1 hypothetical protein [Sedimentitalea xiamensis]